MKNLVIILLFSVTISFMFIRYFVPNINKKNNIDFLETSLSKVLRTVPKFEKVCFFSESLPNETEIYFKTTFILAPRIVFQEQLNKVPKGSYIIMINNNKCTNSKLKSTDFRNETDFLFTEKNNFYCISLLKKK